MQNRGLKSNIAKFIIIVCILLVGFAGGWLIAVGLNKNDYPLLDPSVENSDLQQNFVNFDPLRQDIRGYLRSLNISHSFYFEYLPNGVNIRDGEEIQSVAASLFKTPVVMDLYKLAEKKKINLDDIVTITQDEISMDDIYGNQYNLKPGQTISLRNAAKLALQGSDNTAVAIVRKNVQPLITDDTDSFTSLDITYAPNTTSADAKVLAISARSYSSILKCLYFSCFTTPKDSQEVLSYLVGSADHSRLLAGVGKDLKVAHKIGSGTDTDSDCGIFYYPGKPYLVCLMFWGKGTNELNDTDKYFQTVSQKIYNYINQNGQS